MLQALCHGRSREMRSFDADPEARLRRCGACAAHGALKVVRIAPRILTVQGSSEWHRHCNPNDSMPEARPKIEPSLRVLIVDQNVMRASILEEGLREAGYHNVTVLREMHNLMRRIVDIDPEVIVIDLENPNRDVLEQMFQVSRVVRRPIAMFVDRSDTDMIEAAVDAGVGSYVVDGLKKERVKAVIDMAISRFHAFNKLREELDSARQALDERKIVERAKGILMKQRGMSEEAAYALLRKAAMNENRRISEVAQSVVTASSLLK
jgi:response regulator NasT